MHALKVYWALVGALIRSQTSYRRSYLIEIFGHALVTGSHVGGIIFLFQHAMKIQGWTMWEVLYLYGLTSLAFNVTLVMAEAFEDLGAYIRTGEFDQMLTRPVSPLVQIAAQSFRVERFGGLIQSIAALAVAGHKVGAFTSLVSVGWVVLSLVSCILVYYGLFLANGGAAFWMQENSEAFNAFTYGGMEVAKFPMSVYRDWVQTLFLYFVPIGFVGYLPTARLLGHEPGLMIASPDPFWAPLVGLVFFFTTLAFWNRGVRHYQSTGS